MAISNGKLHKKTDCQSLLSPKTTPATYLRVRVRVRVRVKVRVRVRVRVRVTRG